MVRAVRCIPLQSATGAVTDAEDKGTEMVFRAAVHPIDQRAWRDNQLRPRERRLVLPAGFPGVRQGDRLYLAGEERAFRCTEARTYPHHMEIEMEAMP